MMVAKILDELDCSHGLFRAIDESPGFQAVDDVLIPEPDPLADNDPAVLDALIILQDIIIHRR